MMRGKIILFLVVFLVLIISVFAQSNVPQNIKMISCTEVKDPKFGGTRIDYQFMQFDEKNPSKWQLKTASKPKLECGVIPTEVVSERGIKSMKNVQVSYETFCADAQNVDRKVNECEGRCMSPPGKCEKLKKLPEQKTAAAAPKGDKLVVKDCCVFYEKVEFVKNDKQLKRDIYKGKSLPITIKGGVCGNEHLADNSGGVQGFWITQKVNNACEMNNLLPAVPVARPTPAPAQALQVTCTDIHFWNNAWQELDTTKLPTTLMFHLKYNNLALKGSDFAVVFTPDQGQEITFLGPGNFDKDPNQPRTNPNDGWNNNPVSNVENDPNAQGRMFTTTLDFAGQNLGRGALKVIARGANQACYERQVTIGTPITPPPIQQPAPTCTTQPQISFTPLLNDDGVAIKIIDTCKNIQGQQDQLVQDVKVNNVEYRGLVFLETNADDGTFEHNLLYNYGAPTNPSGGTGLAVKNWYSMTGWSILTGFSSRITGRAFANGQPTKETQINVQAGQIIIEINYAGQKFTSPQITVPPETQTPGQPLAPIPVPTITVIPRTDGKHGFKVVIDDHELLSIYDSSKKDTINFAVWVDAENRRQNFDAIETEINSGIFEALIEVKEWSFMPEYQPGESVYEEVNEGPDDLLAHVVAPLSTGWNIFTGFFSLFTGWQTAPLEQEWVDEVIYTNGGSLGIFYRDGSATYQLPAAPTLVTTPAPVTPNVHVESTNDGVKISVDDVPAGQDSVVVTVNGRAFTINKANDKFELSLPFSANGADVSGQPTLQVTGPSDVTVSISGGTPATHNVPANDPRIPVVTPIHTTTISPTCPAGYLLKQNSLGTLYTEGCEDLSNGNGISATTFWVHMPTLSATIEVSENFDEFDNKRYSLNYCGSVLAGQTLSNSLYSVACGNNNVILNTASGSKTVKAVCEKLDTCSDNNNCRQEQDNNYDNILRGRCLSSDDICADGVNVLVNNKAVIVVDCNDIAEGAFGSQVFYSDGNDLNKLGLLSGCSANKAIKYESYCDDNLVNIPESGDLTGYYACRRAVNCDSGETCTSHESLIYPDKPNYGACTKRK